MAATTALLLVYGLQGGAYDVVSRQGLAIVVWVVLGLGWACGVLPVAAPPRALLVAVGGLAGLTLLTAAGLAWTESAERTAAELARNVHYLGIVALLCSAVPARHAAAVVAGCLTAGGILLALGVASRLFPDLFPDNVIGETFETARLGYPLNYWNAMGTLGAVCVAGGVGFAAHLPQRWLRGAALSLLPLAGAVIFLTYSRAAIVGTAVAVVVVLLASRHRLTALVQLLAGGAVSGIVVLVIREHREISDATGTAGAALIAVVVIAAMAVCGLLGALSAPLDAKRLATRIARPLAIACGTAALVGGGLFGPGLASDAWDEFSKPSSVDSTDPVARLGTLSGYRYEIFASATDAFQAHPWGGTGPGTFEFWFNRNGGGPQLRDAHSLYLEPLAELGIFGLLMTLLLVGGLLAAVIAARRRARSPLEIATTTAGLGLWCVFAVQAGVDWLWEVTALTVLALVGAAAAAMVGARQEAAPASGLGRLAMCSLSVIAVVVQVPGLSAARHQRASEAAGRHGNLPAARAAALASVRAEPWSSEGWGRLAVIDQARGDLVRADADLTRAIRLEPTNWRWRYLRSRVRVARGAPDLALEDFRRARALRPASPFLSAELAALAGG